MKYLNIELSTLRSAEYVGSSPAERGTWLSVSAHCADQENGGRVVGGATWKDRQWQQACGVTMREIRAASRLIMVDGDDVVVFAYPLDKEAEVKAKREAGRRGGQAKTEAKAEAVRENGTKAHAKHSLGSALAYASPEEQSWNLTEGNRNRKGIGIGNKAEARAPEGTKAEPKHSLGREVERTLPPILAETPGFREAWERWLTDLTERNRGKLPTSHQLQLHLEKLLRIATQGGSPIAAIDNAIARALREPDLPLTPGGQRPARNDPEPTTITVTDDDLTSQP